MQQIIRSLLSKRESWFLVEIQYREPTYEARHGRRASPYRFRYRIEARTAADARELALIEFARVSAMSSVGWPRDIVGVEISSTTGAEAPSTIV